MPGSQFGFARCRALAATLGCFTPGVREVPVSNMSEAPPAARTSEHDAVVAAVLERFVADPKTLADLGRGGGDRITIRT